MSGQAASYYNPTQSFADSQPVQSQPAYKPDVTNVYQPAGDAKPPLDLPDQRNQTGHGFEQAFSIDGGPKYNDIWAGALV